MTQKQCDVLIVGGGVSGTALLFTLARYTNAKNIVLLEKYEKIAPLNSDPRSNSQTLHCGDIETNYTLKKAAKVKQIASMVANYGKLFPGLQGVHYAFPKMVLGVGETEIEYIRKRHQEFSAEFPYMQLWDEKRIAEVEPAVALVDGKPRKEPIIASGCVDQICAVNFGKLSESFVEQAKKERAQCDVELNARVKSIRRDGDAFIVDTNQGQYRAGFVAVCAGAHSLLLAHQMGYGLEFSLLPVAGSFYYIPKMLNGKVYTVQNPKLPFAAIHADPDIVVPECSRLGPTALILPKLERYRHGTYLDFLKVLRLDGSVFKVFFDMMLDSDIRQYIIRNALYEVPYVRTWLYLQEARKIVPSLKHSELKFAKRVGGLRPQIVDRKAAKLMMGESVVNPGNGVLFNVTPSPGASTCLGTAYTTTKDIVKHLSLNFDQSRLVSELLGGKDLIP